MKNIADQYKLKLLQDMLEKIDGNLLQMELCEELLKLEGEGELKQVAPQLKTDNEFNKRFQTLLRQQVTKHICVLEGGVGNTITHRDSIIL